MSSSHASVPVRCTASRMRSAALAELAKSNPAAAAESILMRERNMTGMAGTMP
jgi:hypothetical protein